MDADSDKDGSGVEWFCIGFQAACLLFMLTILAGILLAMVTS